MVARLTLDQLILVRIQVSQLNVLSHQRSINSPAPFARLATAEPTVSISTGTVGLVLAHAAA